MTVGSDPGQLLITGGCPDPDPDREAFIGISMFTGMIGPLPLLVSPEPELILPYTTVFVLAA